MSIKFYHLVAASIDNAIGLNNSIPWASKLDMGWFKRTTYKHLIIMGRKTYESLPIKLKDRYIIVLSRDPYYQIEGNPKAEKVIVYGGNYYNRDNIIDQFSEDDEINSEKAFIVGGAEIYDLTKDLIDGALVSEMDLFVPDADTHYDYHKTEGLSKQVIFTNPNETDEERNDPLKEIVFYCKGNETWK